jgi:hypothetical protein
MTNQHATQEVSKIWQILKYAFVIVPIAAGLDKFLNLLVQWDSYLPSFVAGMLPFSTKVFMMIVGVIEIIAGLIVLNKTQLGAYIVAAWLLLIALLLLVSGQHLDVAVRDIVMSLSAWTLARLTGVVTAKAAA